MESGRADDRNTDVIRKRINEYNTKTLPVKTYYSEQAKFHSIDGIGSIDEIFKAIGERITFLNAEMDLTALEHDIEHLDMTIQDFDIANDIAPELLLEIDAIKRAEAEEAEEERENRKKSKAAGKTVVKSKPAVKKKSAPAKKAAPKKTVKAKTKKAVKKTAPKKTAKKTAKPAKKVTPKKTIKKTAKKSSSKNKAKKKR